MIGVSSSRVKMRGQRRAQPARRDPPAWRIGRRDTARYPKLPARTVGTDLLQCRNMATLREVPQRELRNRTADVLREVETGTTIRITVNGRPVADLTPIRRRARFVGADVLDRLYALPTDPSWLDHLADLRADEPEDPWVP